MARMDIYHIYRHTGGHLAHGTICVTAISTGNIETDDGTQVVIVHPDFDHKLVIDSGGLGDFYSHGYDVTLLS